MTAKTPYGVLRATRKLIDKRVTWVKGKFHKRKRIDGKTVHAYCLVGALRKAADSPGDRYLPTSPYWQARKFIASCIRDWDEFGLTSFNDRPATTHADVLKALDCAIEKARKKKL